MLPGYKTPRTKCIAKSECVLQVYVRKWQKYKTVGLCNLKKAERSPGWDLRRFGVTITLQIIVVLWLDIYLRSLLTGIPAVYDRSQSPTYIPTADSSIKMFWHIYIYIYILEGKYWWTDQSQPTIKTQTFASLREPSYLDNVPALTSPHSRPRFVSVWRHTNCVRGLYGPRRPA